MKRIVIKSILVALIVVSALYTLSSINPVLDVTGKKIIRGLAFSIEPYALVSSGKGDIWYLEKDEATGLYCLYSKEIKGKFCLWSSPPRIVEGAPTRYSFRVYSNDETAILINGLPVVVPKSILIYMPTNCTKIKLTYGSQTITLNVCSGEEIYVPAEPLKARVETRYSSQMDWFRFKLGLASTVVLCLFSFLILGRVK